jgi:hypothetical protein
VGTNTDIALANFVIDDMVRVSIASTFGMSVSSGFAPLAIGALTGQSLLLGPNNIQAYDYTAGGDFHGTLFFQPFDGNINVGSTAGTGTTYFLNQNLTALATNNNAMTVGITNGFNMAFAPQQIQARNNGVASIMYLNYNGGQVTIGGGPPGSDLLVSNNAQVNGDAAVLGHFGCNSIAAGVTTVTVTANVISSIALTGFALAAGHTYHAVACASSGAPGEATVAGSVYEVTCDTVTANTLNLYVLRGSSTNTGVQYIIMSDDT